MSLTSRYRALIDQANQAKDRQTCFYYLKQAEKLLQTQSPEQYGIQPVASLVPRSQIQQAA